MSVLIKGMEMPENCRECRFGYDDKCFAEQPFHRFFVGDTHKCPLIELPTHGRLIDADALEQEAQKRLLICNKYDDQFQKPYEVMRAIALAPIIIPAEEGE